MAAFTHDQERSAGPQSASITRHRLFPALVSLWFGGLFFLSSLALRVDSFEAVVVASRLDLLVPAAAPPLGHTARLMLALGFGLIGAALGYSGAKLLSGQPLFFSPLFPPRHAGEDTFSVRARDAHPDAPARRPISAHEELGPDRPEPVAEWKYSAPTVAEPLAQAVPQAEALPVIHQQFIAHPAPPVAPPPVAAPPLPASPEPVVASGPSEAMGDGDAPLTTATRIASAPPAALSHVELVERLAQALHRHPVGEAAIGETPGTPPPATDHASTVEALRKVLAALNGPNENRDRA